ncbi:hypothetical protein BHE74_00024182 [Ensete ventricosum]|nr:hypothetical protein GW17_00020647 [Ensete ventricosum]RWW68305.1 hypothetical protein BHE74_00024182 [Ensete ventricosum]RZS12925.1 hypothetical protein BHM03_00044434 [Ensete ventricosum]
MGCRRSGSHSPQNKSMSERIGGSCEERSRVRILSKCMYPFRWNTVVAASRPFVDTPWDPTVSDPYNNNEDDRF